MDTGLNVRPVPTVASAPVRLDPPAARQTAAPDLPDAKAVTAAREAASVRLYDDNATARGLRAEIEGALAARAGKRPQQPVSEVDIDEATRELVFRKVSPETGRIIGQFPEEAVLRMRAYSAQARREALEAAEEKSAEA